MSVQELRVAVTAERGRTDQFDVRESPRALPESVWNAAAPQLSRLVSAMGLSDRVDDVLQDVYLVGLQKGPQGADPDELRRWLFRVTINRCRLEYRRRRRWEAIRKKLALFRPPSADRGAEAATEQEEQRRIVDESLKTLDPELRSIVVLRYFSGLDSQEIGHILQLPASTVRSHLRKARWKLATALKRMGYDDEIQMSDNT